MVTPERNERMTQVARGTPAGELLRRYWHPLCGASEVTAENPKKRIRILAEDLMVFRAADGSFGCVAERCAHRGCSLYYGFIEEAAIRCPYHGWKFAVDGRVLEQPFEPEGSTFRDKVRQPAYPVEELGGLLFVYMGPQPVPLLPRWDVLVREDGRRSIGIQATLQCNWLQAQENTADTTHTYYLHGEMMEQRGLGSGETRYYHRPIAKYDFSYCEWGIDKRCTYGGEYPEEEIRPPLIFPNILRIPAGAVEHMHWRVPIDRETTRIIMMAFRPESLGVVSTELTTPVEHLPAELDANGEYRLDTFLAQDRMAWETQGAICDRSQEHLGASDEGIIMFRKLLEDQIAFVEQGREPMNVLRDPSKNQIIEFTSHSRNVLEPAS